MVPYLVAIVVAATAQQVRVEVHGSIEGSIAQAAPAEASALAAQVARLLRWRGDVVRSVRPGDELNLLYEGGAAPELVAVSYRGDAINLAAYRFTGADGVARYYDEDGVLVEPTIKNSPLLTYTQITEGVQSGSGKRHHNGLDLKADAGTPVRLPFAGTVTRVSWNHRINGNCVEVKTAKGRLLRFLHLERVAKNVRSKSKLAAGTTIGWVGSTGRSSAPHLHYEVVRTDGKVLDPLQVHGVGTARLSPTEHAAFTRTRTFYESLLARDTASAQRL